MIIVLSGPVGSGKKAVFDQQIRVSFERGRHTVATFKSTYASATVRNLGGLWKLTDADHSLLFIDDSQPFSMALDPKRLEAAIDKSAKALLDWLDATHSDLWLMTAEPRMLTPRLQLKVDTVFSFRAMRSGPSTRSPAWFDEIELLLA